MPAFDDALRLTILDARMQEANIQFGTDQSQRLRDVRRAQVDVVDAWRPMLEDRLLEAVLLIDGTLRQREVAMRHEPGRAVDLREQVRLADGAIGRDDERTMERVADPQIVGVFGEERAAFRDHVAPGSRRDPGVRQQPMHGGPMEGADADDARPLEHPDDAPDGSAGPFPLHAQDLLGHLGWNRATASPIRAIAGEERMKPAVAVGVIPRLDRADGELDAPAVRSFVEAGRGLLAVAASIAVFEARAGQRTEHPQSPERDRLLVLMSHGRGYTGRQRPFLGGSSAFAHPSRSVCGRAAGHMRRTLGWRR